jgi:hypothetical protein
MNHWEVADVPIMNNLKNGIDHVEREVPKYENHKFVCACPFRDLFNSW